MALAVDRKQVLAFRRRAMHLVERLPPGSIVTAARGGLQDSAPRSAVISLAARAYGVQPDDWQHPDVVQIWGPRGAVFVVPAADVDIFTIGRLPRDPDQRAAIEAILTRPAAKRDELRWASPTGRIRIQWDTRDTTVQLVDRPVAADDPEPLRLELARRFLGWLGPATAKAFARWAGIEPADADATWRSLGDELVAVDVDRKRRWLLAGSEPALTAVPTEEPVRWLPQGDPYLLSADRHLLVPEADQRARVFPKSVWPGVLLVDGELVGTWRRQQGRITVDPWHPLPDAVVEAAEAEAARLPLAVDTILVEWASTPTPRPAPATPRSYG